MASKYTTVSGDTFDMIALAAYDEERLAGTIIEVNPDYADVLVFGAGVVLTIPDAEDVKAPATLPPWRR